MGLPDNFKCSSQCTVRPIAELCIIIKWHNTCTCVLRCVLIDWFTYGDRRELSLYIHKHIHCRNVYHTHICIFIYMKILISELYIYWSCRYTWWRHQMETFSALLALCAGNSPVIGEFPHEGQWRWTLMFSLIYASINSWVNNREASYLRHHHAHCDVMFI